MSDVRAVTSGQLPEILGQPLRSQGINYATDNQQLHMDKVNPPGSVQKTVEEQENYASRINAEMRRGRIDVYA